MTDRVFFRSERGGRCRLTAQEQRELLAMYAAWRFSVQQIADHFSVGSGTVYRWLYVLGVTSQDGMTDHERAAFEKRRTNGVKRRTHA